ncbi:O-antigen ligase family protein [Halomonas sp. LR5S13]|uniref:O-antigen ligase family protein n=1 Tax=Halomonas rhizosphaerae TaxID=3043296 RepID=UPI0024A949F0|nr:O-antigen ligase family protein [Halomonas rhizosphaerae]MDI5921014.1 O-antigen ligase family protein [Halomonas rhizosphaerae]
MPILLLAFLLVTLLFSWVSPPLYSLDFQRWAMLIALLGVVGLAGGRERKRLFAGLRCGSSRLLALCTATVVLLVAASLMVSPFPALSSLELVYLLALVMMTGLVALSVRQASLLLWQLTGGMAVLLLTVYALMALDSIHFHWPIFTKRDATPGLGNIRYFSDLAVGLMPLGLVYVVARKKLSLSVALLAALPLAVWWYLLFLTVGRSGVLSLTVAVLVVIVLFRRQAAWPVGTLLFSALPALAAWWRVNPLRELSSNDLTPKSLSDSAGELTGDITVTNDRIYLWQEAWQYAMEHFPLGIGPMGLAGDGLDYHVGSYAHAHNLFLNTAAEWGLPLALVLFAFVLYGCWTIYRRSQSLPNTDKPLYACLVMAFVGVMVNVQFSGAQIIPLSSLVMMLAIGLVFGFRGLEPLPSAASTPRQVGGVGPVVLWAAGMLVLGYLFFAGWSLYQLSLDSTRPCFQILEETAYFPRFWAQGRLECMQIVAPDHWLFWPWPWP